MGFIGDPPVATQLGTHFLYLFKIAFLKTGRRGDQQGRFVRSLSGWLFETMYV